MAAWAIGPAQLETVMLKLNSTAVALKTAAPLMRWLMTGAIVTALAATMVSAQAQGHHGGGPGAGEGAGMMMFGGSPEHVGRAVDHLLDGLGATDAQRSQIKQIATAAAADLKTQRDAGRGLHEKGMQLFAAPSVDAAAVESVRQQMLAQHDQASKRVMQAMLDVSKVLTPEQRAKIGERMQQRQAAMQDRMQRMQREPRTPAARPAQ
jgi:Spy/CpxP family protein refolding chaperone